MGCLYAESFSRRVRVTQRGAVWVEFLVAMSFVLISLFVLIPTLSKYMDVRHKTEQASQYAVWERSVGYSDVRHFGAQEKDVNTLKREVKHRVIADGDTLIFTGQSGDIKSDSFHYFLDGKSSVQNYSELLGTRAGGANQSLSISVSNSNQPKIELVNGTLGALNLSISRVAGVPVPLSMQTKVGEIINPKGYYHSNAQLTMKSPSWFSAFSADTITMDVNNSLLVDGWGAGGVEYNKAQVKKLQPRGFNDNPFSSYLSIKGLLEGYRNFMDVIPVIDGKIGNLDFDVIDSDELLDPTHKMATY